MASIMGIKEGQGQSYSPGKLSALWLQWLGPLTECHWLVVPALCFTTSGWGMESPSRSLLIEEEKHSYSSDFCCFSTEMPLNQNAYLYAQRSSSALWGF